MYAGLLLSSSLADSVGLQEHLPGNGRHPLACHQRCARAPVLTLQLDQLDALRRCTGWELQSAAEDPVSGDVALRVANLFLLRLSISHAGAAASVEVLPGQQADGRALWGADRRRFGVLGTVAPCMLSTTCLS